MNTKNPHSLEHVVFLNLSWAVSGSIHWHWVVKRPASTECRCYEFKAAVKLCNASWARAARNTSDSLCVGLWIFFLVTLLCVQKAFTIDIFFAIPTFTYVPLWRALVHSVRIWEPEHCAGEFSSSGWSLAQSLLYPVLTVYHGLHSRGEACIGAWDSWA